MPSHTTHPELPTDARSRQARGQYHRAVPQPGGKPGLPGAAPPLLENYYFKPRNYIFRPPKGRLDWIYPQGADLDACLAAAQDIQTAIKKEIVGKDNAWAMDYLQNYQRQHGLPVTPREGTPITPYSPPTLYTGISQAQEEIFDATLTRCMQKRGYPPQNMR